MSKQIAELNKNIEQLLSKKQVFIRGMVRGVGFAIGTTVIAAIVLAILGAIFRPVIQNDSVQGFINNSQTQ
jgi:uncharacterized membrane protein YvlD (DUF360 family)